MNLRGSICTVIAANGSIYAVRPHRTKHDQFQAWVTSPVEEPLHIQPLGLDEALDLIGKHIVRSMQTVSAVLTAAGFGPTKVNGG